LYLVQVPDFYWGGISIISLLKKVLLVTDQGIISSGWLDEIIGALKFEGYD